MSDLRYISSTHMFVDQIWKNFIKPQAITIHHQKKISLRAYQLTVEVNSIAHREVFRSANSKIRHLRNVYFQLIIEVNTPCLLKCPSFFSLPEAYTRVRGRRVQQLQFFILNETSDGENVRIFCLNRPATTVTFRITLKSSGTYRE